MRETLDEKDSRKRGDFFNGWYYIDAFLVARTSSLSICSPPPSLASPLCWNVLVGSERKSKREREICCRCFQGNWRQKKSASRRARAACRRFHGEKHFSQVSQNLTSFFFHFFYFLCNAPRWGYELCIVVRNNIPGYDAFNSCFNTHFRFSIK